MYKVYEKIIKRYEKGMEALKLLPEGLRVEQILDSKMNGWNGSLLGTCLKPGRRLAESTLLKWTGFFTFPCVCFCMYTFSKNILIPYSLKSSSFRVREFNYRVIKLPFSFSLCT
ncbi:MAG: hypothetical protein ACPL07_01920 [Candidatus Bathyarchaeia archaeon]